MWVNLLINFHDWVGPEGLEHKIDKFSYRKMSGYYNKNLFLPLLLPAPHPQTWFNSYPKEDDGWAALGAEDTKTKGEIQIVRGKIAKGKLMFLYYIKLPKTTLLYGSTLFTLQKYSIVNLLALVDHLSNWTLLYSLTDEKGQNCGNEQLKWRTRIGRLTHSGTQTLLKGLLRLCASN